MTQKPRTNRRTYMKTLGILGATGLGSTGLVTANGPGQNKGGKQGLDIDTVAFFLNYSVAGKSDRRSNEPNEVKNYGYPPAGPAQEFGGLYFGGTDDGELFDVSEIKLTPNGNTLHHSLQFFAGLLISNDSKMKDYTLNHTGEGRYVSRGQVMDFKTRTGRELLHVLNTKVDDFPKLKELPPPFSKLTEYDEELSWRAACTDRIQLVTKDGDPKPTPEWGITRVDFYERGKGRPEFKISLLYTIWNPSIQGSKEDASGVMVKELIVPGRLNMGGQ